MGLQWFVLVHLPKLKPSHLAVGETVHPQNMRGQTFCWDHLTSMGLTRLPPPIDAAKVNRDQRLKAALEALHAAVAQIKREFIVGDVSEAFQNLLPVDSRRIEIVEAGKEADVFWAGRIAAYVNRGQLQARREEIDLERAIEATPLLTRRNRSLLDASLPSYTLRWPPLLIQFGRELLLLDGWKRLQELMKSGHSKVAVVIVSAADVAAVGAPLVERRRRRHAKRALVLRPHKEIVLAGAEGLHLEFELPVRPHSHRLRYLLMTTRYRLYRLARHLHQMKPSLRKIAIEHIIGRISFRTEQERQSHRSRLQDDIIDIIGFHDIATERENVVRERSLRIRFTGVEHFASVGQFIRDTFSYEQMREYLVIRNAIPDYTFNRQQRRKTDDRNTFSSNMENADSVNATQAAEIIQSALIVRDEYVVFFRGDQAMSHFISIKESINRREKAGGEAYLYSDIKKFANDANHKAFINSRYGLTVNQVNQVNRRFGIDLSICYPYAAPFAAIGDWHNLMFRLSYGGVRITDAMAIEYLSRRLTYGDASAIYSDSNFAEILANLSGLKKNKQPRQMDDPLVYFLDYVCSRQLGLCTEILNSGIEFFKEGKHAFFESWMKRARHFDAQTTDDGDITGDVGTPKVTRETRRKRQKTSSSRL